MSDESNKTEQPTDKRLHEAWDEGRFAKAPDLQMVAVLAAATVVLSAGSRDYCLKIAGIAIGIFSNMGRHTLQVEGVQELARVAATTMLGLCLPVAVACAVAGGLSAGIQSRFRLSPKALGFKLDKLDPMNGFKRIFSAQAGVKLALDLLKLAVVGWILWGGLKKIVGDPIFAVPVAVNRLGSFYQETGAMIMWRALFALAAIGGINYVYQLRKTREEMMMTREEVKEENKQTDGDPKVKAALRAMARRLLQKQMLSAVPTADVIVTNPTHYAVALKFERGKDKAPVVLAKGENAFARRIKALAAEHEVPMIENKPVARMLFKHGKVGKPIPVELYQVVADILAFVYRTHRYYFHQLKQRRAAGNA